MYYWSLPVRRTLRSVHLDARPNHARNVFISCNKLHATRALFHIVACILMHDRTTHGTLFTTFRVFTISCNELHATGENDLTSVRDSRFRATSCTLRGSGYYFCMRRLLAFLRGALYAKAKLNTTGDDMLNETKPQTPFQEKISSLFEQSLTEEQRFLQGILRGEIQTFSHEEVVATLRETLKR